MDTHSFISGFTDEVSENLDLQIKALKELGWRHIDLRTVDGKNVSTLTDEEFAHVYQKLSENGITIGCFGSTVANWGRDAYKDLELDLAEMKNSVRHMLRSGVKFIRIMSYRLEDTIPLDSEIETVIINNIKHLVRLAEEDGIICLHENCETWGGQSVKHTLRLLEQVDSPALKLAYDSGNPVSMKNVDGVEPYDYQNAFQFFKEVLDHIEYLHIKDAKLIDGEVHYTFPGQGSGYIKEILDYIKSKNKIIPIAIEPHVSVVFHNPSVTATFEDRWKNFIAYGSQFEAMAAAAGISFSSDSSN